MKITKKITLNLRKEKGNFIVSDTATLRMMCGTTSVEGNIRFFNIEKKGTKWVVPIKTIKDRINQLEERRKILDERLHIMKQIVEDKK